MYGNPNNVSAAGGAARLSQTAALGVLGPIGSGNANSRTANSKSSKLMEEAGVFVSSGKVGLNIGSMDGAAAHSTMKDYASINGTDEPPGLTAVHNLKRMM